MICVPLEVTDTTIRKLELSLNQKIWFVFYIQAIMKQYLIIITTDPYWHCYKFKKGLHLLFEYIPTFHSGAAILDQHCL